MIATYNSASLFNPFMGFGSSPAMGVVVTDHFCNIGATGTPGALWVYRDDAASGGTGVATAVTAAGVVGEVVITPNSTSGGRIQMEVPPVFLGTDNPVYFEAKVKFAVDGQYYVGLGETAADQAAIISSSAFATNIHGVALLINTDEKGDFIGKGTNGTATTAVTDQYTFTADTYYRIGLKAWSNRCEFYVDGRLIGTFAYATNTVAGAVTPIIGATVDSKALTVDWAVLGF